MSRLEELTPRQRQVLELVAQGKCNKEVAASLGISEHTVEQHLRRIYKTLEVSNRVEASAVFNGRLREDYVLNGNPL
jgi:DNA-binding NarL/FixJ family response regulator